MKASYSLFAVAALISSASAFAGDIPARIPAPSVPPPPTQIQAQTTSAESASPAVNLPLATQKTGDVRSCPSETGSRIRSTSCSSVVRSYSRDELAGTGEASLGAALGKLDPSVTYSRH